MLIRHDLKLIFLHVPKCAGKELRETLKLGASSSSLEELWNYDYDHRLHRYVDLAHLPASDFVHYRQFSFLSTYTVIACIRSPYERLYSASNEYYRQSSRQTEKLVKSGHVTAQMRADYYRQLPTRHAFLDPLYIHSLPIHYFTHLGDQPLVDFILRCETLRSDFLSLSSKINLPSFIVDAASTKLSDVNVAFPHSLLDDKAIALANSLYQLDFTTFGYEQTHPLTQSAALLPSCDSELKSIHQMPSLEMHWGPSAHRQYPSSFQSCR